MSAYELAQLNIGIIKGPMDSAPMAEFAANPRSRLSHSATNVLLRD